MGLRFIKFIKLMPMRRQGCALVEGQRTPSRQLDHIDVIMQPVPMGLDLNPT
jgi:hypothetical protein